MKPTNDGRGSRFGLWRTLLGVVLAVGLFAASFVYLWWKAKRSSDGNILELLGTISVADLGQWLSGLTAALAFIWIVLAYFQQSEELALQRNEIARLANEANRQARSLEETELATRREAFFRMFDRVIEECDRIAANIVHRNPTAFELKGEQNPTPAACAKLLDEQLSPLLLFKLMSKSEVFTEKGKIPISIETDSQGFSAFVIKIQKKEYTLYLEEIDRYYANIDLLLREGERCDSDGAFKSLVQASSSFVFYVAVAQLLRKENHGARLSQYENEEKRLKDLVAHANQLHADSAS